MEVSRIMENVASDLYDLERCTPQFEEDLRKSLRKNHVILRQAWMMDKVKGRRQVFLTMRARSGQCIFHDRDCSASFKILRKFHGTCKWKPMHCKWRIPYSSFYRRCKLPGSLRGSQADPEKRKKFPEIIMCADRKTGADL